MGTLTISAPEQTDDELLARIGAASIVSNPMPDVAPAAGGGYQAVTLNHLAGPGALKEWVELAQSEAQAIQRVQQLAADRARLETHLALAGVPRAALDRALAEAGGTRVAPPR